jgi:hypothetical protein
MLQRRREAKAALLIERVLGDAVSKQDELLIGARLQTMIGMAGDGAGPSVYHLP